jgi:hypothetical protein
MFACVCAFVCVCVCLRVCMCMCSLWPSDSGRYHSRSPARSPRPQTGGRKRAQAAHSRTTAAKSKHGLHQPGGGCFCFFRRPLPFFLSFETFVCCFVCVCVCVCVRVLWVCVCACVFFGVVFLFLNSFPVLPLIRFAPPSSLVFEHAANARQQCAQHARRSRRTGSTETEQTE